MAVRDPGSNVRDRVVIRRHVFVVLNDGGMKYTPSQCCWTGLSGRLIAPMKSRLECLER